MIIPTKATLRDLFHSQSFLADIGSICFDESLDYIQYSFVESYVRREKSSYGKFLASVIGVKCGRSKISKRCG